MNSRSAARAEHRARKRSAQPGPAANPVAKGPIRAFASKPSARWSAFAFLATLCAWRIAAFTPQPLDSPQTLRPMLHGWFAAFVDRYSTLDAAAGDWTMYCFIAMLIPAALALSHLRWPGRGPAWLHSKWLFLASVAALLIVCRLPILLLPEMNPDETQFIVSANKLFHDPVFFRSVDCGTVGPLDVFPLMLPAALGFSPDYASSRALALAIIFLNACFLYRAFAQFVRDDVARIAILPAAGAFAVLRVPDLIHYSSEHVPTLLATIGLYLCARVLMTPRRYSRGLFLLGMATAAAFFAKMQAVPILLAAAAVLVAYVHCSGNAKPPWKPSAMFAAGLAPLGMLNAVVCAATGVWRDFWITYIAGNVHYADSSVASTFRPSAENAGGTALAHLLAFGAYVARHSEIRLLILACLALLAACAYEILRRRPARMDSPTRWLGVLSIAILAAAIFSVYAARNLFTHYLLLLIVPVCTVMAWPLIRRARAAGSQRNLLPGAVFFVIFNLAWQGYLLAIGNPKVFRSIPPTVRSFESDIVASLTKPDETIIVWGWNARPYLGSGRMPATRDTNMTGFFRPPREIADYHRARFLREASQSAPALFIDAVGATGSREMTDRALFGHEAFPDVKAFVAANYAFLRELRGERFFIRKDLARRTLGGSGQIDK